jgi:myosin heavy subunit
VDQTIIENRDQVIMEKDRLVHQLSLEKNNLQSEFNRLKIERDAMAKHVEEMETKLRSMSSEVATKEDKLFDDLQKQLDKSRQTNFNLRNKIAEHEDTIRNQKIDIQQKATQVGSLKQQMTAIQEQADGKQEESDQIEALRKQLHERDSDMERLAETMVELQQDISSKEQEAHTLKTQSDELMMQFAEKESEMNDIREMATIEKESLEQSLLDNDEAIQDLRARFDEANKELNATKNTLEIMEKQGTMSSEEKYQYELNVQKLQKKIDQTKKTLKSVEAFLNTDPKYRVLYLLNDFQRPLVQEELAKILNISHEIASKYIYELDYFGYVKQNIVDGKNLIESTALLTPPLTLEESTEKEEEATKE